MRPNKLSPVHVFVIVTCIVTLGVPLLLFFIAISWGMILAPLPGLVMLAPFILANYLTWGWWLPRRSKRGENDALEDNSN